MQENKDLEFENPGIANSKDIFTAPEIKQDYYSDEEAPKRSLHQRLISSYIVHPPLKYGKKFYWGEFLSERIIQIIALMSIGFIIAIFFYVFQESYWAFTSDHSKPAITETKPETGVQQDLKSEKYSPVSEQSATELKPESYGSSNDALTQERYGSETSGTGELKPEKYSTVDQVLNNQESQSVQSEKIQTMNTRDEISLNEKPVKVSDFFKKNAIVDDRQTWVWQPISEQPKYSLIPLATGAMKVTIIGLLIAAPIAILAAIFTVAFSPKWMKEVIKPAIEILAGFPSVVIGFFCLITLATIMQDIFHTTYRLNSFVGGIGMALAVIPIIYTVTEDALSAVPKSMSEASLAIGASRWQTAWRVILPAAAPGVFAAIILGFGRAFGETMIALMATGNAALTTANIFDSARTMSATIGAEMAEVEFRGVHYGVLFLIGAILFVVTFSLNALAEFYVRKRLLKKFQGK